MATSSDTSAGTSAPSEPCADTVQVVLGVDVGGTSIKAALVDLKDGKLISERIQVSTPKPATPEKCADVVKDMAEQFKWTGRIGIGLPSVVKQGVVCTAANVDKSWIGCNAQDVFSQITSCQVSVVNDADAAAWAEVRYGAGTKCIAKGVMFMVTFGTGIGTAMFVDGVLVPNLELGHMELDGKEAEKEASGVSVKELGLSWEQWAKKAQWYLSYVEALFWPTVFVIGGGVSEAHEQWVPLVKLPQNTPIVPASMGNAAGIVGAALSAETFYVAK